MECWQEELSPVQLEAYERAEREHNDIRSKITDVMKDGSGQNIFNGNIFSAYQITGLVTGLEEVAQPLSTFRNEGKKVRAAVQKSKTGRYTNAPTENIEINDDDDEDFNDEDYMPLAKRKAILKQEKKKESPAVSPAASGKKSAKPEAPVKIPAVVAKVRPSEATSVGGLSLNNAAPAAGKESPSKTKEVVDLTKEDSGKAAADSREITFNKLQGKTYPSLVVVARPSLKIKDGIQSDRGTLDTKVKSVLTYPTTKFTEWLIQQGLVRSAQSCQLHPDTSLKLGMYSDSSKFPYSGGYVWISSCCPTRYVSVFNASIFEGSTHPPSVILKLIYHWACQTNVPNVVQWVKVDNLYVKGIYTFLRAVCTVALYYHITLLGGPGKKIEVGVISLGTTTQDGQQRQVKVEVLGVYDPDGKLIRLRAIEPYTGPDKNNKKRFERILEPLKEWVNRDSIILTDLTVDKSCLHTLGFKTVHQALPSDSSRNSNATIMDYLRRIVPRMFQNTLSLLSRAIIQQFLDELVWREWYGSTPGQAFDNIVNHLAEQTRLDHKSSLTSRLNKVAADPFQNWQHFSATNKPSGKRKMPSASTIPVADDSPKASTPKEKAKQSPATPVSTRRGQVAAPPPTLAVAATPTSSGKIGRPRKEDTADKISLEGYYYATYEGEGTTLQAGEMVNFEIKCPDCDKVLTNNTDLMDHLFTHVTTSVGRKICRYCLDRFTTPEGQTRHILLSHPIDTKYMAQGGGFNCLICEQRHATLVALVSHMGVRHVTSEMPYKCGGCEYRSSVLRQTIDHFYAKHKLSAMLQCPFCLKIYLAATAEETLYANVLGYLKHLRQHMLKTATKKCGRCSLGFVSKSAHKLHQLYAHVSHAWHQNELLPVNKGITNITKPKAKADVAPVRPANPNPSLDGVSMYIPNGRHCLECDYDFEEENHIVGLMKCSKCNKYQTCCLRALMDHYTLCSSPPQSAAPLGADVVCVCGFAGNDGNVVASHMVVCERKSVYATVEEANENTVKRNMLDMLDLVRRPESTPEQPPDEPMEEAPPVQENLEQSDQFNTQLSLDDLAPPSVLPPQQEPDRTPQLRDEYQSLATPQVQGEYEAMQSMDTSSSHFM
uniref:C2H2-type domain-containing protein n=2 Tax=Lutzomyia longipalpis TaxID=7200 RepID=A0A1B0C999_LUTLO